MITEINELTKQITLTKQISCECKCKFNGRNCISDQWWNNDKCWCECKKRHVREKDCVWNSATSNCENEKYLASIMDDSTIMCDEIIEETVPINLSENKTNCKRQNSIFYLHFY